MSETQKRYVMIDTIAAKVIVHDTEAELTELENTAYRLLERGLEVHDKVDSETDPEGTFQ